MNSKHTLRDTMKRRRAELTKEEVRSRSAQIMEHLLALPEFFRADVVHTYISSKNNEADTHELIRLLLKHKKRVVVPVADKASRTMRHSELRSLSELVGGAFGILEPRMVRPVVAADIEIIVVPALAVDRQGRRLGFGAGFYDRFLHDIAVPSIVLAYDFQLVPNVPQEPTDVPVSYVVTEGEIIRCRN